MHFTRANSAAVCLLLALWGSVLPTPASARGFLINRASSIKGQPSMRALENELSTAMGEALGCGGHVSKEDVAQIEQRLGVMWSTLPKNAEGNVDRRSLRNAIHRYFNRRSSLHIRGFEPSRTLNASSWGGDDILGQRVPAYVESVLQSQHKLTQGFTLSDAALMVATIEQLIFDWEGTLLEQVYRDLGKSMTRSLTYHGLVPLLEAFVVYWLFRADPESVGAVLRNRTLLENSVPHWKQVSLFLRGQIKALEYKRQTAPAVALTEASARKGHNGLMSRFSFEDAHTIVGGIAKSFASFWDSECDSMKASLFDMDKQRTGRVPLSVFHSNGLEVDWRFGESEAYLRELGALDDSGWQGKQVMISNYMQAASNCVVSTPHYLVCCRNDCEGLLDEIEAAVGAPAVAPARLLVVVGDIVSQSTIDDDFPTILKDSLPQQLEQIAAVNSGEVPLHGRLFAQWLHYAFPRECAFPHKVGVAAVTTPSEFGDSFYASPEEMMQHASEANESDALAADAGHWMSQWSPEEELAETAAHLHAPWEQRGRALGAAALCVVAIGAALLSHGGLLPGAVGKFTEKNGASLGLPSWNKAHFV